VEPNGEVTPIGAVVAGIAVQRLGVVPTVVGMDTAYVLVTVGMFGNPSLRGIDVRHEPISEPADVDAPAQDAEPASDLGRTNLHGDVQSGQPTHDSRAGELVRKLPGADRGIWTPAGNPQNRETLQLEGQCQLESRASASWSTSSGQSVKVRRG
jgi:hypothetical protein